MNIIGISSYYHDSACCLLQDGNLVAAAAEERFTRKKHDRRLPVRAFRYCLEKGGIGLTEIDCIAFYESPQKKWDRQNCSVTLPLSDPDRPQREIREVLGYEGPLLFFEHHQSHAASAFFYSGFNEAAILTVDGVGEWATSTYCTGTDSEVRCFEEVHFPHSLGLLYSTITSYLGFEVNEGEYKVMGLAPYGNPCFMGQMNQLVSVGAGGQFQLNLEYFDFTQGEQMFSGRLCELFDTQPRSPQSEIKQIHKDVARSLQQCLEEVLLKKVHYLHSRFHSENLCMAGGVALNCVANERILREGPFRNLFVQPAAGDDGGCLGAAALAHIQLTGRRPGLKRLEHVYLGPSYSSAEIGKFLEVIGILPHDFRNRESDLLNLVTDLLVDGKVVGWFQGSMEFGPRALGARSILADPRSLTIRDHLNVLVKKRESFRPFAPSVLLQDVGRCFDLDHPSPFMLETCRVLPGQNLPAITHIDGSARPQTVDPEISPKFAALIRHFYEKTACPVLLNTSFNLRGEPIVCTMDDALRTMIRANLDALVLEDFVIEKDMISTHLRESIEFWFPEQVESDISSAVYTFI